ncbi:MAG: hypothetical protein IJU45_09355, partial [Clostridia bacterium]|nr:hypothetical protein [Clostridia bacterium]
MTYISDSYQYTLPDLTSLLKIFGEKKQFLDNIHWVAYNRLLQYLYDTYLTNINKVVVFDRDWYYHSVVFANLDLHIHFDIEYVHKIETLQIFSDRIVSGSFFTSSVDNS